MAYISKEQVSEIRNTINDTFKNQGFKFSVIRRDGSEIVVSLMVSPFQNTENEQQLNDFRPDFYEKNVETLLTTSNSITESVVMNFNRNADDMGADYPNYNYFKSFQLGKWNKPMVYKENSKFDWNIINEQMKKSIIKRKLTK